MSNPRGHEDGELIEEVKSRAKEVAVSGVIARYDGRVSLSTIACYNNILLYLCQKLNVNFINNDKVRQSLLNRSKLHLSRDGDRVLGNTFCNFLKSVKGSKAMPVISGNDHHFFHRTGHRSPEWIDYLISGSVKLTRHDSEQVRSDFSTCFNSIPNNRGFKMAFLNIVSLSKKIDELRHCSYQQTC